MNLMWTMLLWNIRIINNWKSDNMRKCDVGGQAVIEGVMMRGIKD